MPRPRTYNDDPGAHASCQFHGCTYAGRRTTRAVRIGLRIGAFSIVCCTTHERELRELTGSVEREQFPDRVPADRMQVAV